MMATPNPRQIALDVLGAVRRRDAYANLLLPARLDAAGPAGRDAALATELVYGTLRLLGTYDAVLDRCLPRPDRLHPRVRDVLRLGVHQLLGMRVDPHAAVYESVELARRTGGAVAARLVNAVLRRIADRDLESWLAEVTPADDPVAALGLRYGHPRWIVAAFADALRGDLADVRALLQANNTPAPVHLAARPGRCTVDELLAAGARPGRWAPTAAILDAGAPGRIAAVREGRAGVQDEGSQLVALAAAAPAGAGWWLDLCAGPGGKTALLAAEADRRGARVLAVDLRPHRARLIPRDPRVTVIVADGRRPAWRSGRVDRVLVDVPCTGLGALRRRPELRWRRRPDDVRSLQRLQIELLTAALDAVRPGGLVGYATCSPHPAETIDVVHQVADRVEVLDAREAMVAHARAVPPDLGPGPFVQLWPHRHETDAMFFALLRRR
ncbi:Fmu (Sun) domain protein [Acidothermus cellulolyticus 11B]|uniref:Fmu (Sun) domain protein n=1 Tax=Acidothermus cellulolyticus (strain ATCC 43068 / DSM 8971 / 11B) TaxID=351607 RepID=A0LUD9_ACIC1|nr:transcription antitermination factor NusB [Acidothermus cellulolyticus]ABK53049.1 Fmu (Sun) domain protein [Acidothermus cellulolyticus 11B]